MSKYKVLYTDTENNEYHIEASVLKVVDAEVIHASATDERTLIEEGRDCDGIMTLYADITKNVLDAWGSVGKVKVVSRQGVGYNNIDVEAATANGIMVANVPDYCAEEVADHAITLALGVLRQLKSYNLRVENGEWSETPRSPIHRISTMTFGLFGLGNISRKVAHRAKAFGFDVYAYDPFIDEDMFKKLGIGKVDTLESLASISDILSLHAPLNSATENSVNKNIFTKMKKDSILVNTSRGALVSDSDLIYAIDNGLIAGAGLDVLENEPPASDNGLLGRENVIVTSHMAFYSEESNVEILTKIAQNVADTLTKGKPTYLVNKEVIDKSK